MAVELTDSAKQKLREARSQGKIGSPRKVVVDPKPPKDKSVVGVIKNRADSAAAARLAADKAHGVKRR